MGWRKGNLHFWGKPHVFEKNKLTTFLSDITQEKKNKRGGGGKKVVVLRKGGNESNATHEVGKKKGKEIV